MRSFRVRAAILVPVALVLAISPPASASHDLCHQTGVLDPVGELLIVVDDVANLGACAAENRAPVVDAGSDRSIVAGVDAPLEGTVSDDGLPDPPGRVTVAWSKVTGPGRASFTDPSAADTVVKFPRPGRYVLRLSASDGALTASDDLSIEVRSSTLPPPPGRPNPGSPTDPLLQGSEPIVPVSKRALSDTYPLSLGQVPTVESSPTAEPSTTPFGLPWQAPVVLAAVSLAVWFGNRSGRASATKLASRRFDVVLDVLPDGVVTADASGRVLAVNAAATVLLGSAPDKLRGRALASLVAGSTENGTWLPTWVRAQTGRSAAIVATLERDSIPVGISLVPLPDDEVVCVIRDLRRERAVEHMKREFLANVGHELRTPLTSALGFARILRDRKLSPEQEQSFVSAVVCACEKLDRVVDLLIDVATIEGGVVPEPSDEVDVAALAHAVVERWAGISPKHVFSANIARNVPGVRGNEALLRHALHELVDNAIKFSPDGGLVTITVSDQGIGLTPQAAETMFDDFTQGDASDTRVYGGLGLGLGFVRRVMTLHSGRIDVVSAPDQGTSIRLELPAMERAGSTGAAKARARDPSRA